MNLFYKSGIRCWLSISLLVLISISCQKDDESVDQFLDSLPHEHPEEINRFQQADSVYFGFLLPQTIPLDDGTVLLAPLQSQMLLQVNTNGEIVEQVARSGRGPGEVLDILSLTKTGDGGILLYDQKNNKGMRFNSQLDYEDDIVPSSSFEQSSIIKIYPSKNPEEYLIELSSFAHFMDRNEEPRKYLALYSKETGNFKQSVELKDRAFAMQEGGGSGSYVPFTPVDLIAHNTNSESFYLYRTSSSEIAEISPSFDTLRTIPVDLPAQEMNSAEFDSLQQEIREQQWETFEEKLPDVKTPVDRMKVDSQNRFWLRLNYRGDSQKWLVMDQEGNPQKIVHLPKRSMLTHISDKHLGVRLDDITFTLYEPVD